MTTYETAIIRRWRNCVAETTFDQRAYWARFYTDAYIWCQGVAAELWPDAVDVITPRIADCVETVGPMTSRKQAAGNALRGFGPGDGPKVSAFAANIRGDLDTRVTIDRHMLAMLCPELAPTPKRVRDIETAFLSVYRGRGFTDPAARTYTPAESQAVLWGWWRERKGLPPY